MAGKHVQDKSNHEGTAEQQQQQQQGMLRLAPTCYCVSEQQKFTDGDS
jgi:hypothetical protein